MSRRAASLLNLHASLANMQLSGGVQDGLGIQSPRKCRLSAYGTQYPHPHILLTVELMLRIKDTRLAELEARLRRVEKQKYETRSLLIFSLTAPQSPS
jgi:hypothetical protein